MLKKTIKYEDFNGEEHEEDFYFNFTKAELAELEMSRQGGISEYMKKIVAAKSQPELAALFKEIVLLAYGERSEDGSRFVKTQELRDSFQTTNAYSELYMELITDAEAATEFMKAIIPTFEEQPAERPVPQDHKPKAMPAIPAGPPNPSELAEFEAWKKSQQTPTS
jgi:hypothetical protein